MERAPPDELHEDQCSDTADASSEKADLTMELVIPVPQDAPPPPREHRKLGHPTAIYNYRDMQGSLTCYMVRFDPPEERKIFLPLTLWRGPDNKLLWKFKNLPTPRPLYGRDRLARFPDATVIVCEGEKAADAAQQIFPEFLCVTSPSGANNADKADWSPLDGRDIIIFPDADEAGEKYKVSVSKILSARGCDIQIIDTAYFSSRAPDGSPRKSIAGYDAADTLDEYLDIAQLRAALLSNAQPYKTGRAYISDGHFEMNDNGLYVRAKKNAADDGSDGMVKVSAAFEVLACARDPDNADWGVVIRFVDADHFTHTLYVSYSEIHGDMSGLCGRLSAEGLSIARDQQRPFAKYLATLKPEGRIRLVNRTGWHLIGDRGIFVLPGRAFGHSSAESVMLYGAARSLYEEQGTLEGWQNSIGAFAASHVLPTIAISAAFAGPLLFIASVEGGGLNFYGCSSLGKTTLLQIAASVWGRGGSPGFVRVWRATVNGLEGAAANASDTLLVLDELGVAESRDLASGIYGLANGMGKARAARDGSLRQSKEWRLIFLSSGEIPIETKLREDKGRQPRAGQFVRFIDVPADRGLGFGAFDRAGPDGDASKLSARFKTAAVTAYGTAGPAFVEALLANDVQGSEIRLQIDRFVSDNCPAGADGQVLRVAQRFGLIACAGETATIFGITPWQPGDASRACAWALQQWIDNRGGGEPTEVRQAIEQVRIFIENHGDSRFESLDMSEEAEGGRPVLNRAGWRAGKGPERLWLIPSESWKDICHGQNPRFVASVLSDRGMLLRGPDGHSQVRKIAGVSTRVYVITAAIFDGAGSDDA